MEIQTQAVVLVKKDDRTYSFVCANNSTLGEVYDVIQEMRSYIFERIKEVEQKQNEKKIEPMQEAQ